MKPAPILALAFAAAPSGSCFCQSQPFMERENWVFADEGAWEWTGGGAESVLSLRRQSEFTPKVRSPFNLAWFEGGEWGSFTLTAEVRLDLFNAGNNDVCIAFGKGSETKFYYAHLGEKADKVHLQLHLVNDADREKITGAGAETLPWEQGKWHLVKLVRDIGAGTITVWFDGKQVLAAVDKTLGKGKIGLGSFDDLGSFRNLEITPE